MKTSIIIDTNILLDDPTIIHKLSLKYEKIIITATIMKELDTLKRNKDLSYSARNAIREILDFKKTYPNKIDFSIGEYETDINSNDQKIIQSAIDNKASIATKDMSMSIISEAKGVKTQLFGDSYNNLHNPYIFICIDNIDSLFMYHQVYKDYIIIGDNVIETNQWKFIFLEDCGGSIKYIYATNPIKQVIERIDNIPKYRTIKTDGKTIETNDEYQICAVYALENAPCTILTGKFGSGKTLLATAYALNTAINKIFITRAPVGLNSKYDIGYLPGDKVDKLIEWVSGFVSSLYFIYSNTNNQKTNKDNIGASYDYVKDRIFKERFETVPINSIQGLSILEGDIFIADEIQLITIDLLSMLLSRPNVGAKLILLGDLNQTYNVVRNSESGLLKLMRLLPNNNICHVDLKTSYRSNLTELADKLQDKTI